MPREIDKPNEQNRTDGQNPKRTIDFIKKRAEINKHKSLVDDIEFAGHIKTKKPKEDDIARIGQWQERMKGEKDKSNLKSEIIVNDEVREYNAEIESVQERHDSAFFDGENVLGEEKTNSFKNNEIVQSPTDINSNEYIRENIGGENENLDANKPFSEEPNGMESNKWRVVKHSKLEDNNVSGVQSDSNGNGYIRETFVGINESPGVDNLSKKENPNGMKSELENSQGEIVESPLGNSGASEAQYQERLDQRKNVNNGELNDGQYYEGAVERLRSNPIFQQYEKAISQLYSAGLPESCKKVFCPSPDLMEKIMPYLGEGGMETFGPLFQQYTDKVKEAFDALNHDSHDNHDLKHMWHELEHEFIHAFEHAAEHHGTHHLLEKTAEKIIEIMKHPQEYKDAIKSLIVVSFIAKAINSMAEYIDKTKSTALDTLTSALEKMKSQPQSPLKFKSSIDRWKEPLRLSGVMRGEYILSLARQLAKEAKGLLKESSPIANDLKSIVKDLADLHFNIIPISGEFAKASKVDEVNSNEKNNPDRLDRNNNSDLPRRQSSFGMPPIPGASWREEVFMRNRNFEKMPKLTEGINSSQDRVGGIKTPQDYLNRKLDLERRQMVYRQGGSYLARSLIGNVSSIEKMLRHIKR